MWSDDVIREMMQTAVEQEVEWANFILGNRIVGMNKDTTELYTQWLANQRLAMIGIPALYPSATKNPYPHLDRLQNPNADKGNFFETTVINYTQSSGMNGKWDF